MSDTQSYLEELNIKKTLVGGFDKESVYTAMQELSLMYQKDMSQLKAEKERLESVNHKTTDELEQANKEIQQLRFQLEAEQKSRNEYDARFNALTQAIDAVNASKEKVIEESKKMADGIIAEANEKFERIKEECRFQTQQKELALSKMVEVKQRFNCSMDNLRSILTEMLVEIDGMQEENLEQALEEDKTEEKTECIESQTGVYDQTNRLVQMMAGCVSEYDS